MQTNAKVTFDIQAKTALKTLLLVSRESLGSD